ncbi:MAG: hypothetical protein AAF902_00505 [Chloroflexota bacterium]
MKDFLCPDDEASREWLNFLTLRQIDDEAEAFVMNHLRTHVNLDDDQLNKVLDIMHDILAEEFIAN